MILATYQSLDYLTWENKRYPKLKELLGLSQDTNLYWCISANTIQEIIVNTYTTVANQPSLFVLFETESFYRIDAIKWNHYVETLDKNLLTEDLFNIEHEDAIEYIVTSIPDKRFEINTTPHEMLTVIEDENNKYYKSIAKYSGQIIQGLELFPTSDEIENMRMEIKGNIYEYLLLLRKYFIAFKTSLLAPLYFVGMDYLGHTSYSDLKIKIPTLDEALTIEIAHSNIYNDYNTTENLYIRYKSIRQLVYKKIFIINKIYPNDPCPCGSGKKYKKCCGKN